MLLPSCYTQTVNQETRKLWAEKTFELTNIGAGALIFGQAFSSEKFSAINALLGVLLIIGGYLASYILLKKRR